MRRHSIHRALSASAAAALVALAVAVPSSATGMASSGAPPHHASTHHASPHNALTAQRASAPTTAQVGEWSVTAVGPDSYTLTWVSPTDIPVSEARPEFWTGDTPLGAPSLAADGRTLSLTVTADSPPDPARLSVLLSGRILDEAAEPAPSLGGAPYTEPRGRQLLPSDPGEPGSHEVRTRNYRLQPTKLPGLPAPVEMLGHVVEPIDADTSHPLVLFLHGRHEPCYGRPSNPHAPFRDWPCMRGMKPVPSHLGYDYVQRLLASQGYVTVSISANGINAQDYRVGDGGAKARGILVRRHLAQWAAWAGAGDVAADLDNVVLVGHSRGGEGVDRASIVTPLSAPYHISGQVLLGPTDFGRQAAAYIPTVTVLPYCDGDVSDLQGQTFTDVARDLADDDTALHSSILVMGANHNFFNTEWTPGLSKAPSFDDWFGPRRATCGTQNPQRLSAVEQQDVGKAYIAGAVHLMADQDATMLPLFDGSAVQLASAGDADVRSHTVGAGRQLRKPGIDATLGPATDATTQLCIGRTDFEPTPAMCGRSADYGQTPHWVPPYPRGLPATREFEMAWTTPGASGGLVLSQPLDLSAASSLDLRTIVDPAVGDVRLDVRLYDGSGSSALVTPDGSGLVPALPGRWSPLAKRWAQTLRVPLAAVTGVDLTDITRVDLVAASDDGHVWVLDLAAAQEALPTPPVLRLPHVTLGAVDVDEGDDPNGTDVDVPFSLSSPVAAPATLTILGSTPNFQALKPIKLTLQPGQSAGTFPLHVAADTVDDLGVRRFRLAAFATKAVMTGDYSGSVVVHDDDPAPRVRVRAASPVREGHPVLVRVSLSEPVDYYMSAIATAVRGDVDVPQLAVGDVPPRFVATQAAPRTPLYRAGLFIGRTLRPGRQEATLRLPVRDDGRREGREALTLKVRVPELRKTVLVTVFVRDAR